jgi:hydrogenase maturation protease
MSPVCVVGLGQPEAGDDAVGWAVVDRLRGQLANVALVCTTDPTLLVERVESAALVIVVDALLAAPPGRVRVVGPADLATVRAVSSHSLAVRDAIALGRCLASPAAEVRLVAVTIERPRSPTRALSPEAAAAVEPAADSVCELVRAFRESTLSWLPVR